MGVSPSAVKAREDAFFAGEEVPYQKTFARKSPMLLAMEMESRGLTWGDLLREYSALKKLDAWDDYHVCFMGKSMSNDKRITEDDVVNLYSVGRGAAAISIESKDVGCLFFETPILRRDRPMIGAGAAGAVSTLRSLVRPQTAETERGIETTFRNAHLSEAQLKSAVEEDQEWQLALLFHSIDNKRFDNVDTLLRTGASLLAENSTVLGPTIVASGSNRLLNMYLDTVEQHAPMLWNLDEWADLAHHMKIAIFQAARIMPSMLGKLITFATTPLLTNFATGEKQRLFVDSSRSPRPIHEAIKLAVQSACRRGTRESIKAVFSDMQPWVLRPDIVPRSLLLDLFHEAAVRGGCSKLKHGLPTPSMVDWYKLDPKSVASSPSEVQARARASAILQFGVRAPVLHTLQLGDVLANILDKATSVWEIACFFNAALIGRIDRDEFRAFLKAVHENTQRTILLTDGSDKRAVAVASVAPKFDVTVYFGYCETASSIRSLSLLRTMLRGITFDPSGVNAAKLRRRCLRKDWVEGAAAVTRASIGFATRSAPRTSVPATDIERKQVLKHLVRHMSDTPFELGDMGPIIEVIDARVFGKGKKPTPPVWSKKVRSVYVDADGSMPDDVLDSLQRAVPYPGPIGTGMPSRK